MDFAALPDEPAEGGPTLYCCSQAVLFVKKSKDPESKKIAKLQKPVGHNVYSTGRTWRGPSGGLWAELDVVRGELGWVLVEGPGFGLSGPALVDASKDKGFARVEVVLLDHLACVVFDSMLSRETSVRQLKKMLCQRTGLLQGHCVLGKDPPTHPDSGEPISIDYMPALPEEATVDSLGLGGAGRLYLIYLDEFPEDFKRGPRVQIDKVFGERAPVTWRAKPGGE